MEVLIFISLMASDVHHLFMCLLVIHVSSLVKCLFFGLFFFKRFHLRESVRQRKKVQAGGEGEEKEEGECRA